MNTDLRKNEKNEFEKDFFKLMNNSVFGKTMENIRHYRDIHLVATDRKRKKLVSEPNYLATKHFSENLMAIEMRKTNLFMNKPIYLGKTILDISETLMYEFYYDYLKPKFEDKVKLYYMDTDSFILHIKTEDFYKNIADDVNEWFDISCYNKDSNKPLPIGENKKVLRKFKDESGENIMIKHCSPKPKTRADIFDNDEEIKKAKGTKKCVIKNNLRFEDYEKSVLKNKTTLREQYTFKVDHQRVYTLKTNKIAISPNDDKRLQIYDNVTTYQYGMPAVIVCKSQTLAEKQDKLIGMDY